MPGFLLHRGATVMCLHPPGQAQPLVTDLRVKVGGMPIVVQTAPYTIAACILPSSAGGPCATALWITAATRVRASGVPVLLDDSRAVCAPTGTGLNVMVTQKRAKAT
jgi:hypothetical protein